MEKTSVTVKVLFFGATAELAGTREAEISDAVDVSDVFAKARVRFPRLGTRNLLFALNQGYASGSEAVSDGDEIAIFAPVSGG